ncbi:MAG: hypothetical protein GY849_24110, partial [Deltaproteobacteria bacterium]|nr:hypothetical protein [Deltaproteobacteria bacterium]
MPSFKNKTISERLIEEVKGFIGQANQASLKRLIDDTRPADLADLIEHLNPQERLFIFKL